MQTTSVFYIYIHAYPLGYNLIDAGTLTKNHRAAALHLNMHKYRKSILSEMVRLRARAQPLLMRR